MAIKTYRNTNRIAYVTADAQSDQSLCCLYEDPDIHHTAGGPRSAVGNVSGNSLSHASLTADPEVPSSIPARSHTFVEIDHEISPLFRWIIQEGLLSSTSESMCIKYWLTACSSLLRKKCG